MKKNRVLKYFQIDLSGNISEMCGTDAVVPFKDERRSIMSNIKLYDKHTAFMIKVNRRKPRYTRTDITFTGATIEYKNWCFADVYIVQRGKSCFGYYYEDIMENKKWLNITIPSVLHPYFESTLKQLRDVCFGEDCIYAHDIYAVDEIINRLIELDAGHLPVNLNQCSYAEF